MVTDELWRMREKHAQASNLRTMIEGLPPEKVLQVVLGEWQPEYGDPAMQAVLRDIMPHLATLADKLLQTVVGDSARAITKLEAPKVPAHNGIGLGFYGFELLDTG